jgi:hypothetical protein
MAEEHDHGKNHIGTSQIELVLKLLILWVFDLLANDNGGMESGDAKRLKQLEDENRKLKHVVAELTLDNRALKDVLSKNWWRLRDFGQPLAT